MMLNILISIVLLTLSPAGDLFQKAESLYSAGKLKEAMSIAEDAASRALEDLDTTSLIKAYCLQADIAIDNGNDLAAVDFYNKCIDYFPYGEPMFMLSSSLYNIASIYFQNEENDKALEYITKSIMIDSRRESDAVLALRYLLAAEILYKKGEYAKAIEMADGGHNYSIRKKNYNVQARLMLVKAKCREALAGENPDWKQIEQEYRSALEILRTTNKGYYYGPNPYAPEFLYHLGLAVSAQGKDAREYFLEAINISRSSLKMHGVNPVVETECCKALADILLKEGHKDQAQEYLDRVESLSYVPYINKMGNKISLSQMEFIRREKELEIERQKDRNFFLGIIVSILALAIVGILLMYRRQVRQKKMIEQKNAQLMKLGLQKDKLIDMLQAGNSPGIDDKELKAIKSENVPLPDIKLSKREKEVLKYCCQGLISKEIAAKMEVSVRTVESHKFNLFRKIGVNTTGELIAYAFKTGLIK